MGPGTAEATFPKIELPGVDREQAEAVAEILTAAEEHKAHIAAQQSGLILAMFRLRKPISTGRRSNRQHHAQHEGTVFERMAARLEVSAARRERRAAA